MSLWTPYKQDTPLDLSCHSVKVESASPVPASSVPPYPSPPAGSSAGYVYPSYPEPQYYATYPYQSAATYAVPPPPTAIMSPESLGSRTHSRQSASSPSESQEYYDSSSLLNDEEYLAFERDTLQAMAAKNGGTLLGSNPRMRRAVQSSRTADDAYRQQRERNNQAAKLSRDRKRIREVRLATQASFLQKKVATLSAQLAARVCERCRSSD